MCFKGGERVRLAGVKLNAFLGEGLSCSVAFDVIVLVPLPAQGCPAYLSARLAWVLVEEHAALLY